VTAVIVWSAVQVALGAFTSAADGAMVKLARFGTVRAFPPEDDDSMGCPTSVLGSEEADGEGVMDASVDEGEAIGSLVTFSGGWLTGTAESDSEGKGAPDPDALSHQLKVKDH